MICFAPLSLPKRSDVDVDSEEAEEEHSLVSRMGSLRSAVKEKKKVGRR